MGESIDIELKGYDLVIHDDDPDLLVTKARWSATIHQI